MTQEDFTPRILYIGGAERSGTTLLSEMIGAQPKVLNAGELSLFWRDASRGSRCACGEKITSCPVWGAALHSIEKSHGVTPQEYARLAATRAALARTRSLPRLLRVLGTQPEQRSQDVRRLIEATDALIEAAHALTDTSILVDSSKTLPALIFNRLLERGIVFVHLVRDARAVVASSARSVDVQRGNAESLPPGATTFPALLRWVRMNAQAGIAGILEARRTRILYEDLVGNPRAVIAGVCDLAGISFDESTIRGQEAHLPATSHAAVGNPARAGGNVRLLRLDDGWRRELPMRVAFGVRLMTWPMQEVLTRRAPQEP